MYYFYYQLVKVNLHVGLFELTHISGKSQIKRLHEISVKFNNKKEKYQIIIQKKLSNYNF